MLQAENLHYGYQPGQPVLRGVSLDMAANSIVYLLGHNGSGKTTLLEVLSGVRQPQQGSVRLNGADLFRLPAAQRARRVGLVPQTHAPVFAYTVHDVVMMGRTPHLRLLATPDRHDRVIVDEALALVGLEDFRHRPYTELSGGEQQLVLIARGIAQQTDVLLLDEPTAHLDPRNQQMVLETVAQLAAVRVAFVISSHNPTSALLYADQVVVLKAGQVLASGTPGEVLTEEMLSRSYDMPVEVLYNERQVARAVVPRRVNGSDSKANGTGFSA